MAFFILFLFFCISHFSSLPLAASSPLFSSSSFCPKESHLFLSSLQYQCPISTFFNPPRQVDGNFLDKVLASSKSNGHISVLFYASWCPFSHNMPHIFEILSAIFPQMEHLIIEQSSAMPSVFSRYGIHSLPSILIVNQTSSLRYHGPKDLKSIVQFYEKVTGFQAAQQIDDQLDSYVSEENYVRQMLHSFPMEVLSQLKAFWVLCISNLNMEIFGETSQIMGRVIQTVDVRRMLAKVSGSKIRKLHESTRNAKVWASSLASVSLGESSSSARSSPT